jgi:3-hydroxyisobutyrate dehydrogenase-like beta-hydroxyacid dehydrogenase
MVTIIGLGAVGSAVSRRLRRHGHDVTGWNRSQGIAEGARAVASSALVLLTVTDHAAAQECLELFDADLSGRTVVGMFTGTADQARLAAAQVAERGGQYLDAGLQSSPETIDAGTATIVYSGPRPAFEQHRETLAGLGEPRFAGAAPEAAASWDLALFGIWYDAQLGLLRALDTARAAGIDLDEFGRTAMTQLGHVVSGVAGTVAELRQGVHPRGPADLTEHLPVVRHLIDQRAGQALGDGGLPEISARLEALIAAGRGGEGLTAVTETSRPVG